MDRSRSRRRNKHSWHEEKQISKLLTKILRHTFQELGLFKDLDGFVSLDHLLPHLRGYCADKVLEAACHSYNNNEARFEVTEDSFGNHRIRVIHPYSSRLRRSWHSHQYEESWKPSYWKDSRWEEQAVADEDDGAADDPRMLVSFLRAALNWLSSYSVVPDTQSIKNFITSWKQMGRQDAQRSEDGDRQHCLALIAGQIAALDRLLFTIERSGWQLWNPCRWDVDATQWSPGGEPTRLYWANFYLSEYLSAMKLEDYDSSWQMSWAEVCSLFDRGQWYDL